MIVPFFIPHAGCPHQCVFCDQRRISGAAEGPDPASLASTIERYCAADRAGAPAEVAFFGGTFTSLPLGMQRAFLAPVQPFVASGAVRSIRVSTRPDAVSGEVLELLSRHHVATVELGAQSMDNEVLRLSGRGHGAGDTVRAAALLRGQGFAVGMQLMPGLPGDSPEVFLRTVDQVIGLAPSFVRIYPALVISGTPLERLYRDGRYSPLSLEAAVSLCAEALDRFRHAGIGVIRVGLQPTEELARTGTVAAGPFHPAFRQLVESARFLRKMLQTGREKDAVFLVNPRDLSTAVGQRKSNLSVLRDRCGKSVAILPDPSVPQGSVALQEACAERADGL